MHRVEISMTENVYIQNTEFNRRIIDTTDMHLGWTVRAAFIRRCNCRQCWQCYVLDVYLAFLAGNFEVGATLFRKGSWSQWEQVRFVLSHGNFILGNVDRDIFYTHLS
jgi:hypothetical protein